MEIFFSIRIVFGFGNLLLSGLQIFQRILSQSQHIILESIVLRVCALIRCTVGVLHRELTTTVTDQDDGSLELGVTLLGFPYIQLAYPIDLAVPCAERIDTEGRCALCIASLFLITDASPERRQVEEQTVVVFCPAWTLEGDKLRTVGALHLKTLEDGVCRGILREASARIQLYGHLPSVVVDAAFASTDGMVVVLHVVETDTT